MTLSYTDIFSYFIGNIEDYKLTALEDFEVEELEAEYLRKALGQAYITRLFSSLTADDETGELIYELRNSSGEFSDELFVLTLLSKAMVIEWLSPQVRSKVNISQYFTKSDAKYFSQANHIAELRAMLEDLQNEVRNMIGDRGYVYNAYLDS